MDLNGSIYNRDNMGILEKTEETEKCHYCHHIAKYNDVAEVDQTKYKLVSVCECHSYKGLSA